MALFDPLFLVTMSKCHFIDFNILGSNSAAIDIESRSLIWREAHYFTNKIH